MMTLIEDVLISTGGLAVSGKGTKLNKHLHKELDHSVPQRPEVDKQHCDEVAERHLEEDVVITTRLAL